jgi:hypothetical protein
MPSLTRTSRSPCASSIQQSSLPFLKHSHTFAGNLFRLSGTTHTTIVQTTECDFVTIGEALEAVKRKSTVENSIHSICTTIRTQLCGLRDNALHFLNDLDNIELLGQIDFDQKVLLRGGRSNHESSPHEWISIDSRVEFSKNRV